MIYVFDTSSLVIASRHLGHDLFPTFWKKLEDCISKKRAVSVREVFNEIVDYGNSLSNWAQKFKSDFFPVPSEDEQVIVTQILQKKENQALISDQKIATGGRVADPFVIAKAKHISGCVITEDGFNNKGQLKEHASKMAPICKKLRVRCVNLNDFMRRENWRF